MFEEVGSTKGVGRGEVRLGNSIFSEHDSKDMLVTYRMCRMSQPEFVAEQSPVGKCGVEKTHWWFQLCSLRVHPD